MPFGVARNVGGVEIGPAVASVALQRRRTVTVRSAHHQRPMQPHAIGLMRRVARRMAVHATRMLQHLAGLRKESDRAGPRVGKARKVGGGAQVARPLWERLSQGAPRMKRCGNRHAEGDGGSRSRKAAPLHHVARTTGSRRGRPRPNRAMALATAGPIGGTPGSPTPLGFSVERITVTSTSGISSMRSER